MFPLQIFSECNIYEAGQKKVAFKYLTEKVSSFFIFIYQLHVFKISDLYMQ